MNRYLFVRLLVPLLILSVVSLFLSSYFSNIGFDKAGFFLNLGNDTLAIAITVWYVDRILKSHEKKRWQYAKELIGDRINRFFVGSIRILIELIGLEHIYTEKILEKIQQGIEPNSPHFRKLFISFTQEMLTNEKIELGVRGISEAQRLQTIEDIEKLLGEATSIIDVFGHRLSPEVMSLILEVQNCLNGIESTLYILSPIFEIKDEDVPSDRKEKVESIRESVYRSIVNSISTTVEKLSNLGKHMQTLSHF